jgi:hypothetical protein
VTIEDEEAPGFAKRVPQALEIILANAENEAVSVVLIHSNESHFKAAAEQELLRELPADIGKNRYAEFCKILARTRSSPVERNGHRHPLGGRVAGEVSRFCSRSHF